MKKLLLPIVALCLVPVLSSCSLLPEEEVYETSPLVRRADPVDYTLAYVQKGEMSRIESVTCTYVPVRTEVYAFGTGGVLIEKVYVQRGDSVKAGTVMAQLDMGDYPTRIEQGELSLKKLNIRLKHEEKNAEIAIKRYEKYLSTLTTAELREVKSLGEYRREREDAIGALKEEIEIAEMRLEEYRQEVAKRQIVADFDGTVTYIRNYETGDMSVENERFIRVADTSLSVFSADVKNHDLLKSGDYVVIDVSKTEYNAVVASAQELGLEETEEADNGKKTVYFRLLDPAVELEGGDRGTFRLMLEHKDETLFVPKNAVFTVDGKAAVYQTNEYGLKSPVYVETGIMNEKYTEIVSGLSEGDAVITK